MIGYTLNLRLLTYLRLSAYCSAKNFTQNIHIFLQSTSQCNFHFLWLTIYAHPLNICKHDAGKRFSASCQN